MCSENLFRSQLYDLVSTDVPGCLELYDTHGQRVWMPSAHMRELDANLRRRSRLFAERQVSRVGRPQVALGYSTDVERFHSDTIRGARRKAASAELSHRSSLCQEGMRTPGATPPRARCANSTSTSVIKR
jgi:hypothetical protein